MSDGDVSREGHLITVLVNKQMRSQRKHKHQGRNGWFLKRYVLFFLFICTVYTYTHVHICIYTMQTHTHTHTHTHPEQTLTLTALSSSSCSVLIIQRRSVHRCTPPPHNHHHPTQQGGFPRSTVSDRPLNATLPWGTLPCRAPAEAVIRPRLHGL